MRNVISEPRNKNPKSPKSGALCRGFLCLKMCRLRVSSSPRDLQRWCEDIARKTGRVWPPAKDIFKQTVCNLFQGLFTVGGSWPSFSTLLNNCNCNLPRNGTLATGDLSCIFLHRSCLVRCHLVIPFLHLSSSFTYIHRIAMYIFNIFMPLNASCILNLYWNVFFFWTALNSFCLRVSMCYFHPSLGTRWQCFCKRFPGSSVLQKVANLHAISIHTKSMLKHITGVDFLDIWYVWNANT